MQIAKARIAKYIRAVGTTPSFYHRGTRSGEIWMRECRADLGVHPLMLANDVEERVLMYMWAMKT